MSLSANFTVNSAANPAAHVAAYDSTVTLALTSATGASSIVWEIMACSHSGDAIPTITTSGSPSGVTASFVMPSDPLDGLGRSFLVRCTVSNQVRGADGSYESSIAYGVVGAQNVATILPIVPGEENYRHATHGWSPEVNALLAGVGGGGGGTGDVVGPASSVDNRVALFNGTSGKLLKVATPLISDLLLKSGSVAMTGDLDLGTHKAINAGAPVNPTDLATKAYVDARGSGGASGFRFTYSATTTDADPGAGTLRISSASYAAAGTFTLYIDLAEYGGTDVTAWLDAIDDYAGAIKGVLRLSSLSDLTKWVEYVVTTWTTAAGYRKITGAYKDGPGGLTTTAGDTFVSLDYATSIVGGTSVTVSSAGLVARAALTGDVTASADSNATTIANNAVTTAKILNANVTLAKLAVGTAAGQQTFWDGSAWRLFGLLTGTNLTDADQTLAIAGGAQYLLSASLTVSREKRLGITGVSAGLMLTIYSIATRAFTMVVKDDVAGTTLFTFPASATPIVATFRVNDAATAWTLSGWAPMATVV